MKKTLLTLAVIGLLSTTTTQAGLLDHFGAPWVRGGVRWPSLTLGGGDATVTIGPKASKGDAAKKKAIAARKKKAASKKK